MASNRTFPQIEVPPYVQSLVPYVPGKPIEETQREFGLKRVVKLASNENPLGPSPKAKQEFLKTSLDLHRYPDASAYHLKAALEAHLGVPTSNIIVGNGSNEIIEFLFRSFCVPGDRMVTSQGAFIAYKICAQIQGVQTLEVPIDKNLKIDPKKVVDAVKQNPRVKIVWIANPNNPTGTYMNNSEMRAMLKGIESIKGTSTLVVLDYAYWEYVTAKDLPDPIELQREFPNVVVLRTFSKVYGLAGLRVGYAIADETIISTMEKVRQPFNLNLPAMSAAIAALKDQAFVKKSRALNREGMKFWEQGLKKLSIPYWSSQGNFILADVMAGLGKPGGEVFQSCLRRGVIFRPVANYGMLNALRISIGLPEENRFALEALKREKNG